MTNFFRRNQKKLLAILGSILMVVFILPFTGNQGRSPRQDPGIAYAGEEKIHGSEMAAAKADWEILKKVPTFSPMVAQQFGRPGVERGHLAGVCTGSGTSVGEDAGEAC